MELLTSEIGFSNKDKSDNIILPSYLDENLAEFIGIVAGDGHLNCYSRNNWRYYSIVITCNLNEDKFYFNNVIQSKFKKLFNTCLNITCNKKKNYFNAYNYSKAIVNYINKNFSIPIGNKSSDVNIPNNIMESGKLVLFFIRGLADTDFSLSFKNKGKLHDYPVIKGSFKSRILVDNLNKSLTNFGFCTNVCFNERNFDKRFGKGYERHSIYLSGKNNLEKWISLIGFNNPRLMTKYMIWKKFGYCLPNTTINERINSLSKDNITRQRGFEPRTYSSRPQQIEGCRSIQAELLAHRQLSNSNYI